MTRHVIFRANASINSGGGHVVRCMTLANVLHQNGWLCSLATNRETLTFFPYLKDSVFKIIFVENFSDFYKKIPTLSDVLVIDDYQSDINFEIACREYFKHIVVVDDLADKLHDCDLLLDQNPGRLAEDYDRLIPPHAKLLVGPKYALLGSQFRILRNKVLKQRSYRKSPPHIVIMLGLTDPLSITPKVLLITHNTCPESTIDILLSAKAASVSDLKHITSNKMPKVRLLINQWDTVSVLAKANICIGAGGTSALERCCLGLPSLILTTASNQEMSAKTLGLKGATQHLGDANKLFDIKLATSLLKLSNDFDKQRSMATIGASICDGKGAIRVARAINAL